MPPGRPVVTAEAVNKRYAAGGESVQALRDVSLRVMPGEFLAIMGPSGCGKTTLLNCVSGLDEVDAGRVSIEGQLLHALSDDARTSLRARRMGFVFQSYNLIPVLSAVENVELPLLVAGRNGGESRAAALRALADVGLAQRATHRPRELSGGEQQRVAIARALVNSPAIVFADEPTGNLDSATGAGILALLSRLNRERGVTLLVVTHEHAVSRFADRVLRMESGRIVREERGGKAR